VTIYAVAVHETTHTCPANNQPHVIDTQRRILHITPGGPCRTPITIRIGATSVQVPCGRHEPDDRQCPACRAITVTHTHTSTHLDHRPERRAA
jgi:hypothetical protein